MKKTIGLIFLLLSAILGILFWDNQKTKVYLIEGENAPISVQLHYDMGKIEIHPWLDEDTGIWYVFFPSYIKTNVIDCRKLEYGKLYIDGENENGQFEWQDNTTYELVYGENTMQMVFLEDKNLSTLFIRTESGSNELMQSAKENVEEGYIVSLNHQGKMEYGGKLSISGHGNAWQFYDKRAYDIRLNNSATLAGIDGGSHWKLLHLSNDGDKLHSKLAFDIAEILGAAYTPQATWVNVYLNGEYHGMYLLTTAVRDQNVFKSENVVFLEKDLQDRYEIEEHIISKEGNGFVIHRPRNVDAERKNEILDMVQNVEDSIDAGVLDSKLIDMDSFAIQYLVDEIALNGDAFETSAYLYQLSENAPLCAGPAWDYDAGFGEALHVDRNLANTEWTVLDGEHTELTWYQKLYDNPEFLKLVAEKYENAMPQLQELYEETIDLYADYIRGSVRNDFVRWKGNFKTSPKTGTYQTWENNLRYLKYFCLNRYNALMDRWDIESEALVWEEKQEGHEVTLLYGGTSEEIMVADGSTLDLTQISEFYNQEGCVARIGYSEEEFSSYLPVLEDLTIKLEMEPKIGQTENCKFMVLPVDMFAERYNCVSVFVIDSAGNTKSLLSAEPFKENIYLEFPKDETGTVAMYVFADETATTVIDEVMIVY